MLFVILAFLAWETDSVQGPAAAAAGVVALGVSYSLLYRGRFRVAGLAASGVVIVLGGVAGALLLKPDGVAASAASAARHAPWLLAGFFARLLLLPLLASAMT